MSSSAVGNVYQRIIQEVVEGCTQAFEEEGVDKALLEDLKKSWQGKLSERNVATMPWDPPPASSSTSTVMAGSTQAAVKSEPKVKAEPTDYPPPARGQTYDPSSRAAQVRAAQHLETRFGEQAAVQINQLREAQLPNSLPPHAQQQYRQQMANANALNAQRTPVGAAQTDGAAEWDSTLAQRSAVSVESAQEADLTLKQRVQLMATELEGGGLMAPSSSQRRTQAPSRRVATQTTAPSGPGRFDGADNDDVKADPEEDLINSDLDDDDDDEDAAEDDGQTGELMLCTYDKVQRVKNKWKCTLKDGVLTTGGKEYVFGRAQGEFEW